MQMCTNFIIIIIIIIIIDYWLLLIIKMATLDNAGSINLNLLIKGRRWKERLSLPTDNPELRIGIRHCFHSYISQFITHNFNIKRRMKSVVK